MQENQESEKIRTHNSFNDVSQIRWEMSDSDYNMPPIKKISNDDIQKLEYWIEAGYQQ